MDARHFDHLARSLSAAGTRRGLLAVLAALPLLGGLFALLDEETDAKGRRKRRKQRHKKRTGKRKDNQKGKHKGKHKKKPMLSCTPDALATTCAGRCGSVVNNCQQAVDCGPCDCEPPCPHCQTCDAASSQCVPDPAAAGADCAPCRRCDGSGACVECTPCCDDVCCPDAGSICHLGSGACCVPESESQTCAHTCGSVTNNCGQEVDCGDCTCNPVCPICQSCDLETGACVASGNGDACNDGDPCTTGSTCSGGTCGAGSPVVCNDPNECQTGPGTCVPATGACSYPAKSDGTRCGDKCTQACTAGVCGSGSPVVCDSPNECQSAGTCDPGTGLCSAPTDKPDGTRCGDKCTRACTAGACVASTPVSCPATQCQTAGTCNPSTGLCSAPTNDPNGTSCSTGRCCDGVCPPPPTCLASSVCCGSDDPAPCFTLCCSRLAEGAFCGYKCAAGLYGSGCGSDGDCQRGICICGTCCGAPGDSCLNPGDCCSGVCNGEVCN